MLKNIFLFSAIVSLALGFTISEGISPREESGFEIFSRLCVTMLPEHGGGPRQPPPFPVAIEMVPDLPTYQRGQQVQITLRGNPGFMFTGFLVQCRIPGQTTPHGRWTAGPTGVAVGCANPQPDFSGDDTAAHQIGSVRNIQTLVFEMPQQPGLYRLEMTTVETFGIYWMDQFSPLFNVV
ncbi:CLUMA_CG021326, isoform A [Clunio marinus]|uniref:CLUMA_CG021326, isoform A n=1 Tax=Clunio marinus TaxID=568069 RepID=A0A1J1J7L1_9DIPT|nr:CLUMA_CG021326, isoform A [Clunio marinus]